MVDAYPYNDVCGVFYLAPGSANNYTAWTPAANNADISLGSSTFGNYAYHYFKHYDSLLGSITNASATPNSTRIAPKMRYTSFCVELGNLSALNSVNGAVRCCRMSSPSLTPLVAGAAGTLTQPWSDALSFFYENPDTQHIVGAEATQALCAHALPTQLMTGQFYTPSGEGVDQLGAVATTAWAATVYDSSTSSAGGTDQVMLWSLLRFVVDSVSQTTTLEMVFKGTVEFLIPPESFLVGAAVPRPVGEFTGILRKAAAMARAPPIGYAPNASTGTRVIAGVTGVPAPQPYGRSSKAKTKKQAADQRRRQGKQQNPTTPAPTMPPGYKKMLRAINSGVKNVALNALGNVVASRVAPPPGMQAIRNGELRRLRRR